MDLNAPITIPTAGPMDAELDEDDDDARSTLVTPLPANTREAPLKSAVVATFSGSNSAPAGVEVTATVSSTINVAEPVAAPTQFPATAQVDIIPLSIASEAAEESLPSDLNEIVSSEFTSTEGTGETAAVSADSEQPTEEQYVSPEMTPSISTEVPAPLASDDSEVPIANSPDADDAPISNSVVSETVMTGDDATEITAEIAWSQLPPKDPELVVADFVASVEVKDDNAELDSDDERAELQAQEWLAIKAAKEAADEEVRVKSATAKREREKSALAAEKAAKKIAAAEKASEKKEGGKDTDANSLSTSVNDGHKNSGDAAEVADVPELVVLPYIESTATATGFPKNLLTMTRSIGYNSAKSANLNLLSHEIFVTIAGNVLQFTNMKTGEHTYQRSVSGVGLGAVAIHPSNNFFAVGELGPNAVINIFSYPECQLVRVLKGGSVQGYASLGFNSSGTKLASVATSPCYMLTVWDWVNSVTELRAKAFSSDVWRVTFNPANDGQLTTSGNGHIRFWRMASTFTGLKLQGQIGRFGRTEMTDIAGGVEFPDGKVLTTTEHGSLLLWEGDLVKMELSRKGGKKCHIGPVECVYLEDGAIVTAGADGVIRIWDMEAIDLADRPAEGIPFEIEPMMERRVSVGVDVHVKSMCRSLENSAVERKGDDESVMWVVQDMKGGIWLVDLSMSHTVSVPLKVLSFHAGAIRRLAKCPCAHLLASIGNDNNIRLMNYENNQLLSVKAFSIGVTALLWTPLQFDISGRSVLAGFADGCLRLFSLTDSNELNLVFACKPHVSAIKMLALSPNAKCLVTLVEEDGKSVLFFLAVSIDSVQPVGFVEVAAIINGLVWSPKSDSILLAGQDGVVYQFEVPQASQHNTDISYFLEDVTAKKFIVDYSKTAEVVAEPKGKDGKPVEPEKDKDGNVIKKPPPPPERITGPVLQVWYTLHGSVLLSLGGNGAGLLLECNLDTPQPIMVHYLTAGITIVAHSTSEAGLYTVMGTSDGSVRLHDSTNLSRAFHIAMHDGALTDVTASFDGSSLFSCGKDGNIFSYDVKLDGVSKKKNALGELRVLSKVEDVIDSKEYSFEQKKQRAELDRRMFTAEERKTADRRTVVTYRKQFEKLLAENSQLPASLQLSLETLEIDPGLSSAISAETSSGLARVAAEMAWDLDKHTIAHHKLHSHFMTTVQANRFLVKAFKTKDVVSTYRTPVPSMEFNVRAQRLSSLFDTLTNSVTVLGKATSASRQSMNLNKQPAGIRFDGASSGGLSPFGTPSRIPSTIFSEEHEVSSSLMASMAGGMATEMGATLGLSSNKQRLMAAAQKANDAKEKRRVRTERWEAFLATRPDENNGDPEDVAAIINASENMGDYRLKTALDYVVPEKDRVNTNKKRDQLIILRGRMFDAKTTFNVLVSRLRDRKVEIIAKVAGLRDQLMPVLVALGEGFALLPPLPSMDASEQPDKIQEFTKETLDRFRLEQSERDERARKAAAGGGFGGFGGGAGGVEAVAATIAEVTDCKAEELGSAAPYEEEERSALEIQLESNRINKLRLERDAILKEIAGILGQFDADLYLMLRLQNHTELRIKSAEYKHVLFYQELVHLRVFDKREEKLEEKLTGKKSEMSLTKTSIKVSNNKIAHSQKDLARFVAQEKSNAQQFASILTDNSKFDKVLTRIYKTKVVRAKKKAEGATEDSDEESESESESDGGSDDGSGDDDDLDVNVCPPGVDKSVYVRLMNLREMQANNSDILGETKKLFDQQKKDAENLLKKEKLLAAAILACEKEIELFHLEKQAKLNELNIAVPLRISQIQFIENNTFPKSLAPAVLFSTENIDLLKNRIVRLTEEKALQKKEYKDIKQTQSKMDADRKRKETELEVLKTKCDELQMLKFGMLIDLDVIANRGGINTAAEELRDRQAQLSEEHEREMAALEAEILGEQSAVMDLTRTSTSLLTAIAGFESGRRDLEKSLNSKQRSVTLAPGTLHQADESRDRLLALTQTQALEVNKLRFEIQRLTRKTGHVLPPQSPGRGGSSQNSMLPPI